MSPLLDIQRRLVELGRIRLGEKGPKGEPKKLGTFRLTSYSKTLLDAAAVLYGGTVRPWVGAPNEGTFELLTSATEMDCVIPPIPTLCSQYYELWSGGGCKRRCDGETELLSGGPCQCDKDARQAKEKGTCSVTTRISVMLPRLPGLGLWRLESHGWNAASTLPSTVELLSGTGQFVPAVLRLEQRSEKKDGQTKRYVVPVIDLPGVTLGALLQSGAATLLLGGPAATPANVKVARPALAEPVELPDENPDWKANGGSAPFKQLMGDLETVGQKEIAAWEKKWSALVAKLSGDELSRVKARIEEIRDLPF